MRMLTAHLAANLAIWVLSLRILRDDGNQLVQAEAELEFKGHKLKLLSPTQSVMDRLAAYFYWNDLQCLDQAIWIAKKHPVQIAKVKAWAKHEGEEEKLKFFLKSLKN